MNFIKSIPPFRQLIKLYSAVVESIVALNDIALSLRTIKDSMVAESASKSEPLEIIPIDGYKFLLDKRSLVDRMVIETGFWEREQVDFLLKISKRYFSPGESFFLDIGSYWGWYSFNMIKSGIFSKLYAFDADPYNYSQLRSNIFLNACEDVLHATHAAVSDSTNELVMQKSSSIVDGNRGATRILNEHEIYPNDMNVRTVNAIAIDDFLKFNNKELVIKMDVEGHEDRALIGMKNLIKNNKVVIQVEIYKEQASKVLPIIESFGLKKINQIYPDFYFTNIDEISPQNF